MDITQYRTEVQEMLQRIEENYGNDSRKTIAACNRLLQYTEKNQDNFLIGYAYFYRGSTYYTLNDIARFYRDILSAVPALEQADAPAYVLLSENMLGIMAMNRGNEPFAMDYFIRAMNTATKNHLDDLLWMVHMNIGSLYLAVEDSELAERHFLAAYDYVRSHGEMEDGALNLCAACTNLGKSSLASYHLEEADRYSEMITKECYPALSPEKCIPAFCFQARLFAEENRTEELEHCIGVIRKSMDSEIQVLDVFDDLYGYLDLLVRCNRTQEFAEIYDHFYPLVRGTAILNLERKLLELKIRVLKKEEETPEKNGKKDESRKVYSRYAEVTMSMDRDTRLIMANEIQLRSSLQDLTEINLRVEAENQKLQIKSETDALTGMYNRFRMNTYLEQSFQDAYQRRIFFAIEILDIDHFKNINDSFGHQSGDEYIKKIASCLEEQRAHGNVFCARYGGDEFVIIYTDYAKQDVYEMAEELQKRVERMKLPCPAGSQEPYVTISQGICWGIPSGYQEAWDYLRQADTLLYEVKQENRNGIRIGSCSND